MGGGEKYLCAMARALADDTAYDVTLLSDSRPIDPKHVERFFSISLERVRLRHVSPRQTRRALHEASIAVVMSNYRSLGLPATKNVYILQIPYPDISAGTLAHDFMRGEIRESAKNLLRLRLLATCRSASAVFVYSSFVQSALREHHHLDTTVLYPPIDDFSSAKPKEQLILSVGRFFQGQYNDKRYDVLIDAFKTLCQRPIAKGWQYCIAGSCSDDAASQAWLADLRERARGYPIQFQVNISHAALADLYGRASLLWHAAGYSIDQVQHPERTEHFGMTPVEAMSAACVPLVVDAGGTRETVEHGVSGYLWSTTNKLLEHTEQVLSTSAQLAALQHGARECFKRFSRKSFNDAVLLQFQNLKSTAG